MIWRSGDLEIERKIEEIRVIREIRGEKKVFGALWLSGSV
jgi:hypothetical protein